MKSKQKTDKATGMTTKNNETGELYIYTHSNQVIENTCSRKQNPAGFRESRMNTMAQNKRELHKLIETINRKKGTNPY